MNAGDRGSILPLVAVVAFALVAVVITIGVTTEYSVRSARAQWAADAAALAAAAVGPDSGGTEAARRLAEANGAQLVGVSVTDRQAPEISRPAATSLGPVVVVEVVYDGIRAEAAAQRVRAGSP